MKFLDKIALVVFSTIILILSIVSCLLVFGWIDLGIVHSLMVDVLNNGTASNIIIGVSIIFILLAIKAIFFESTRREKDDLGEGILLQNQDGKLLITRNTLESLVNGVVAGFDSAKNATSKIVLDKDSNLSVIVTLDVANNAVIKELTNNLQTKIKEVIKKSSDLQVKEVDVRVRDMKTEEPKIEE